MIKAVIFDFDGTILDTETPWFDAFVEMYEEHGAELTMTVYSKIIGTNSKNKDFIDPYGNLEKLTNKKLNHQELKEKVRARHLTLMNEQQIRPGVLEYLEKAKELGLKIGLASSSNKAWVTEYLNKLGIGHYFEIMMTADDVEYVKPDPELYVKALQYLGVSGEEAIAIEDSPNGAKAAVQAGIHTVITPNKVTATMDFEGHKVKLPSLKELDLEEVIRRVQ